MSTQAATDATGSGKSSRKPNSSNRQSSRSILLLNCPHKVRTYQLHRFQRHVSRSRSTFINRYRSHQRTTRPGLRRAPRWALLPLIQLSSECTPSGRSCDTAVAPRVASLADPARYRPERSPKFTHASTYHRHSVTPVCGRRTCLTLRLRQASWAPPLAPLRSTLPLLGHASSAAMGHRDRSSAPASTASKSLRHADRRPLLRQPLKAAQPAPAWPTAAAAGRSVCRGHTASPPQGMATGPSMTPATGLLGVPSPATPAAPRSCPWPLPGPPPPVRPLLLQVLHQG